MAGKILKKYLRFLQQPDHAGIEDPILVQRDGVGSSMLAAEGLPAIDWHELFSHGTSPVPHSLGSRFLESPRGRIATMLRRGRDTVDGLARALGLTENAVRAQLAGMEADGLVRRSGHRPGVTRPAQLYELTPELEQLLSRAYVPLLVHLVGVLSDQVTPRELDGLMRRAGRELAHEMRPDSRGIPSSFPARVRWAASLLDRELGTASEVKRANAHFVVHGHGCPLAALTGKHPGVCHAIESLVSELLGTRVRECCDRSGRPRCCFEIQPPPERPASVAPA